MKKETVLNLVVAAGLLAVPLIAWMLDEPFIVTLATRVAVLALAGVGLNLALGLGGMISFGHAAFFGLGGYVLGILVHHKQTFEPFLTWPFLFSGSSSMLIIWLATIIVCSIVALIIGICSLRTSGVYFIMITLAFAQMLFYLSLSSTTYGGEDGLPIYLRSLFPGLNTMHSVQFFLICYGVLLIALYLFSRIAASPFGLALTATRWNSQRVTAVGIKPFKLKLIAFVLSAAITGLAGALFADLNRFVSPAMFSWHLSGELLVFIILGGVARLFGPVLGAALYIGLEHVWGGYSEHWQIYLGVILLFVVLRAPGGLLGLCLGTEKRHA